MVLKYETAAKEVYDKLREIPRTGWVMREVPEPETVYDHTLSLVELARSLQERLDLSDDDLEDLVEILEIHDWAEALAGDEFIPNDDEQSYQERKEAKAERELKALEEILTGKDYGSRVQSLWNRYEAGADPIAKLAKDLDKYQALDLALEYELQHGIPLFQEFYDYYVRDNTFRHPIIVEMVRELHDRFTEIRQAD